MISTKSPQQSRPALNFISGAVLLAFAFALPDAAVAQGEVTVSMDAGADIKTMCGTKPTLVALVDGYGADTWRKEAIAELKDEASKCPNITDVLYADGAGDPAKTNSDMNSLVAQGVNVMIVFPDFGEAMIPAMRAAVQAGVVVVPYNATLKGTPGVDFTANEYQNFTKAAEKWAKWLDANMKKGTVLYFSGPAGNSFSQAFNNGIKEVFARYPNLKLLQDQWVPTNWNPADAQKAAVGVIAQYGKVDAILSDNGPVTLAVVRAFEQANLPLPYLANLASNNEINCAYLETKKSGKPWNYMTLDGTISQVRFALRRGLAAFQGTKDPDPLGMEAFVFADGVAGKDPKCSASAPPDADLSGKLTDEQLKAVFKQ
jgi:ribose transport system substrate-binding protein